MLVPYKDQHNVYMIVTNTTDKTLNAVIQKVGYGDLDVKSDVTSYSISLNNSPTVNYTYVTFIKDQDVIYTVWTNQVLSAVVKTDLSKGQSSLYSQPEDVAISIFITNNLVYLVGMNQGLWALTEGSSVILQPSVAKIILGGGKGATPISYYIAYQNETGIYIALLAHQPANGTQGVQTLFSLGQFAKENKTILDFDYFLNPDTPVVLVQENDGQRRIQMVTLNSKGEEVNTNTLPDTPSLPFETWVQSQKGIGGEYVACLLRDWSWTWTGVSCYRLELDRNTVTNVITSGVPAGHLMYVGE